MRGKSSHGILWELFFGFCYIALAGVVITVVGAIFDNSAFSFAASPTTITTIFSGSRVLLVRSIHSWSVVSESFFI